MTRMQCIGEEAASKRCSRLFLAILKALEPIIPWGANAGLWSTAAALTQLGGDIPQQKAGSHIISKILP